MSYPDAVAAAETKLKEAMHLIGVWNDQSTWNSYGPHGSHERAVAMNRGHLRAYTAKLDALQDLEAAGGGGRSLRAIQHEIDRVETEIVGDKRRLQEWGEISY